MTGIVFNLPNKPKNQPQRIAPDPDVADQSNVHKPWTRHVVGDKRSAGDGGVSADKTSKHQKIAFQKRPNLQPVQQRTGKGAHTVSHSGGTQQTATQDVPADLKLGMSLEEIVKKSKAEKPTADRDVGTHMGKKQQAKATKIAAALMEASGMRPQQGHSEQQQQHQHQQHPKPKNPHPESHNKAIQKQQQHLLHQPKQQQQNIAFHSTINNSNINNPNNQQYQHAQSLPAFPVIGLGTAKAQKQAQRFNLHSNKVSLNSNNNNQYTEIEDQVSFQDFQEMPALPQRRSKKVYIPYAPQPQQAQQRQHQYYQQQQQPFVYIEQEPHDQQLYQQQGGDEMLQEDAAANAMYLQGAGGWLDSTGQEYMESGAIMDLNAPDQQQQQQYQLQLHQQAGHMSMKKQRKLAAAAERAEWLAGGLQQRGPQLTFAPHQGAFFDTNAAEQQQGFLHHNDQYNDYDQYDEGEEEEAQQQLQQHQQQQQQQYQLPQVHLPSHDYQGISGKGLHRTVQEFGASHMPGLHGFPVDMASLAYQEPRLPNNNSRRQNSEGQYSGMEHDNTAGASMGHRGGGSGQAMYDAYGQGQRYSQPDSSAAPEQGHTRDARELISARRAFDSEPPSRLQQNLSMPGIRHNSTQHTEDSQSDGRREVDSPGGSRRQRHSGQWALHADNEHVQQRLEDEQAHTNGMSMQDHHHENKHRLHREDQQAADYADRLGSEERDPQRHRSQTQPPPAASGLRVPVSRHRDQDGFMAQSQESERSRQFQQGGHLPARQQEQHHQWQQQRQSMSADLEPAGPAQQYQQHDTSASRDASPEQDHTWDPRSRAEDTDLYKLHQIAEPERAYNQPMRYAGSAQQLSRSAGDRNGDDVPSLYAQPSAKAYSPQRVHSFELEEGESDWQQQPQQGLQQQTNLASDEQHHVSNPDSSPRLAQQPTRKRQANQHEDAEAGNHTATHPSNPSRILHSNPRDLEEERSTQQTGSALRKQQQQQQRDGQHPRFQNAVNEAGVGRRWVEFPKRGGQSRLAPEESYKEAGRTAQMNARQRSKEILMQDRSEEPADLDRRLDPSNHTSSACNNEGRHEASAGIRPVAAATAHTNTTKGPRAASLGPLPFTQASNLQAFPGRFPRRDSSPPASAQAANASNHRPTVNSDTLGQATSRAPLSLASLRTSNPVPSNAAAAARRPGTAGNGTQRRVAPEVISIDDDEASLDPPHSTTARIAKRQHQAAVGPAVPAHVTSQPALRLHQSATAAAATVQIRPASSPPASTEPQAAADVSTMARHTAAGGVAGAANGTPAASTQLIRALDSGAANHKQPARNSAGFTREAATTINNSVAAVPTASPRLSSRPQIPQFSSRAAALQAAAANGIPGLLSLGTAAAAAISAAPAAAAGIKLAGSHVSADVKFEAAVKQTMGATATREAPSALVAASVESAIDAACGVTQQPANVASAPLALAAKLDTAPTAAAAVAVPSIHTSWRQQRKQAKPLQPPQQQAPEPAAAPSGREGDVDVVIPRVIVIKQEPTRR